MGTDTNFWSWSGRTSAKVEYAMMSVVDFFVLC